MSIAYNLLEILKRENLYLFQKTYTFCKSIKVHKILIQTYFNMVAPLD